jgi:trehalose 6-phosphate phosphatase
VPLPDPLSRIAGQPRVSAFVTDFDGTLAPIVDAPAAAEPLPEALRALETLSAHLGLVAIVSGRPVEFLRGRIPVDGVVLVGQYGLERLVDGRVEIDPRAELYTDPIARATERAAELWPALTIERKGEIAFTVHWRTASDAEPHPADLAALANDFGLAMQPGRKACELRPPVPVDKGTTFYDLASPYEHKAFAGDDSGDLAAFTQEFGEPDHTTQPVRIAVRSPEAPPELIERADVIVDGPVGLAALLGDLAHAISASPPP